tara:strand:+ start:1401 stop:1925 length:525 start_codon:yes stop_codon:yes gene_type:complete
MAERTTEATNTLETFRVNFNALVDDIGDVYVGTSKQLNTNATTVVGAINEILAGFTLRSQISGDPQNNQIQGNGDEVLTLKGGTGVHAGDETTNIVTDITADDTMSFLLNDNIASLASVQTTKIFPTSGTTVVLENNNSPTTDKFSIQFVSPGDSVLDFGSTQGFAAAMAVALG